MEKRLFKTATYMDLPLKISNADSKFQLKKKLAEVFASIDESTGEVKFYISPEDLEEFKQEK